MFLLLGLPEPLSGTVWVSRFFIFYKNRGMAKVRIVMAMTLDGFLPEDNENLMQWVKTDKKGFPHWKEECVYPLFPDYPLIDLVCNKDRTDDSFIYYAEISDKDSAELLRGLFLYHIVDEMVVYLLPVTAGKGIHLMKQVSSCHWSLHKVKQYSNGICYMIYRRCKRLF